MISKRERRRLYTANLMLGTLAYDVYLDNTHADERLDLMEDLMWMINEYYPLDRIAIETNKNWWLAQWNGPYYTKILLNNKKIDIEFMAQFIDFYRNANKILNSILWLEIKLIESMYE